jgi:glutamyl-tRNA synthetase
MKSDAELAALTLSFAIEQGLFGSPGQKPDSQQENLFTAAIHLVKERAVMLAEIPEKLRYIFSEPVMPAKEEFFPKKADLTATTELLRKARSIISSLAEAPNDEEAEITLKAFAEKEELKLGDLMMPLRVAITGARVSPPLFGSLKLLGAEKALVRVDRALEGLSR